MRKILTIASAAVLFSAAAMAATWTGTLVDATCMNQRVRGNQQQSNAPAQESQSMCIPTDATSNFGIVVHGRTLLLNAAGNQKAQSALKNRAERAVNPNQANNGNRRVIAKVTGTLQGNMIETQSLVIR
jgi:hypothetical protein